MGASVAYDAMSRGEIQVAADAYFQRCTLLRALTAQVETPPEHPYFNGSGGFFQTGRLKLRHDAEQIDYLVERNLLSDKPYGQIGRLYRKLIQQLPSDLHVVNVQPFRKGFDRFHNRALHLTRPPRIKGAVLNRS